MMSTSSRESRARAAVRRFPRRRSALVALAAVGMVGLSVLVAGCGGSPGAGVAQITTNKTSTTGASPSSSGKGDPVAYSRCMRSHGVANFPDPDSNGSFAIVSGTSHGHQVGIDVHSPQFERAQQACQRLLPGGRPDLGAQQQQTLKFARCMRAHGVPRFPDPNANGEITIDKGSPGVDVRSPQFQAAQKACHALVPGSPSFGAGH